MAIETQFKDTKLDFFRRIDTVQIITQSNYDTTARGNINKILSITADVKCCNMENLIGEGVINGSINYKAIYLDENNALQGCDFFADFTQTVYSPLFVADMYTICRSNLIDIDSAIVGNTIKVQAVIDVAVYGVISQESTCLKEINAITKTEDATAQSFINGISDSFVVSETFDTGADVEQVLFYDCNATIEKTKISENSILLSGSVCGQIIYTTGGVVVSKNFDSPYSEQIDAFGATPESPESVNVCIKDCRLTLGGVENNNKIILDITVGVNAPLFTLENVEVISDVFAPDFEIEYDKQSVAFNYFAFGRHYEEKISGIARLEDDMDSIAYIICSNVSKNTVANVIAGDNTVTVEGLLSASVIYADEGERINSVQVELPYSLTFDSENVSAQDMLLSDVSACSVSAKIKRDKEMEVIACLKFCIRVYKLAEFSCISSVEVGEEKNSSLKALEIYFPSRGETLWDIAKAMGASIDQLLMQNPDLEEIASGDERIIIYRMLAGA